MRTHTRAWTIVFGAVVVLTLLAQGGRATAHAQQPAGEAVIARVTIASAEEMTRIIELGLDLLEHREGADLFILTTPEQVEELRARGFRISIDEPQTAVIRHQVGTQTFNGGYSTVPEMRAMLEDRAARYPNLADFFIYGSSWQKLNSQGGHDLFGIRLTNTLIPGPKPTFFLMAAIHARELSVSELALRFIDHLLQGYGVDADATWLLDEHLIVVVPVVNPDGRRLAEQGYFQRKNMNPTNGFGCANPPTPTNQLGIDLNRNFNFKWGTVNTPSEPACGQTYPGPIAESEPETQEIQDLVRTLIPDQRGAGDNDPAPLTTTGLLLTLHSYGNLVLWPWGYTGNTAPNAGDLSLIGRKFAGYNGYTPQQSIQLYPTSGTTDDWSYGELGIPSFTFEVGLSWGTCGGFMPPYSCLDGETNGSFWPLNLPAFLYAARIARTPYRLVRGPTVETLNLIGDEGGTELRALVDEQRNGGQRIAAAEYYLDTPPWRGGTPIPMTALDGSFDSVVETATATVGTLTGRHIAFVRSQDEAGNWGPVRAIFIADSVLSSLSFNPGEAIGGKRSIGTVTLEAPAPDGGAVVSLTSDNTAVVTVPVSVVIPAGQTMQTFTAKTSPVSASTDVTVVATYGEGSAQGVLRVIPPSLKSLSVVKVSFVAPCQTTTGKVTLTGKAPAGGVQITLTTTNTALTIPSSVTVPAGSTDVTFLISAPAVSTTTTGLVKATPADPAFGTNTVTKKVSVLPNQPASLVVPTPITGPATVTASVTLTCAAGAQGQVVLLSTSDAAIAEPVDQFGNPISSMTIAAGQTGGTFRVRAADVTAPSVVKIRAKVNGVVKAVAVTVN
jgi:carboxypeptidase T